VQTDSSIAQRLVMLETLVEAANDAMFAVDAHGRLVLWNRGAERMCGYSVDDVLGDAVPRLFPSDLRDAIRAAVTAVLSGERVDHWETTMERRDGMPVSVSLSLHPVFDDDETPCGAVAIACDTTEQHLAQEMLAASEARLQEGEALAHVGRWLWDVPTGTVTRSLVMIISMAMWLRVSKRISRLVRMPTSLLEASVIGRPEIWYLAMTSLAWSILSEGRMQIGS
jgi:PAS domain S-box-containing protein